MWNTECNQQFCSEALDQVVLVPTIVEFHPNSNASGPSPAVDPSMELIVQISGTAFEQCSASTLMSTTASTRVNINRPESSRRTRKSKSSPNGFMRRSLIHLPSKLSHDPSSSGGHTGHSNWKVRLQDVKENFATHSGCPLLIYDHNNGN